MSYFSLSEVEGLATRFPTMPLMQLRSLVNATVSDMKTTFDGYQSEIEDWASGGWRGEQTLKKHYANAFNHPHEKIRDLQAFDTIIRALSKREEEELRKALDRRHQAA